MHGMSSLRALVAQCDYPGYVFKVNADKGADGLLQPWFQIECPEGVDTTTGEPLAWKGRKWKLSFHMTDTEVVQTVWAAVQRALIHEASELFTFTGVAIYNRHISVHALAGMAADDGVLDGRVPL